MRAASGNRRIVRAASTRAGALGGSRLWQLGDIRRGIILARQLDHLQRHARRDRRDNRRGHRRFRRLWTLRLDRPLKATDQDFQRTITGSSVPVLVDFYADWCVSCKEMEKFTFPDEGVRAALANTVWLQADVTANDETDQALLKHFNIYGPPTIAFYGADGIERTRYRVVGFMKTAEFAPLAAAAVASPSTNQ